jgi:hypothetical protein
MPPYGDGKGDRSGQDAPLLNTNYHALAKNLRRLVITSVYSEFDPHLNCGVQPQRMGTTEQHTRAADVLCPALEP